MQHLDEGTIHAWLDGELPPDEAEDAARHVEACEHCRALVTEARGLVAGATRIVSALDAGPAGVIPRTEAGPSARRRAWHRFALTPARMSIAATIVVAVGLILTARHGAEDNDSARRRLIDSPVPLTRESARVTSKADSVSTAPASLTSGAPTASTKAKSVGASAARPASAPLPTAPPPSVGAITMQKQKTLSADKPAALEAAARQVAAAPAPQPLAQAAARGDSARAKDETGKVAFDSVSRASTEALARRRAVVTGNVNQLSEVVALNDRDAKSPTSVITLPSCYRLEIDTTVWRGVPAAFALQGQPAAVGEGAARGGAGPRRASAAVSTSGASQPASAVLALPAPEHSVRALGPSGRVDSAVVGAWTLSGRDSITVRLSSVNSNNPVTIVLARLGANARVVSSDRTDTVRVVRMSCPP